LLVFIMGSTLPDGWQQVCTKGHAAADHSTKCTNWICPQGRRYKEWADVQAYFQLLYFEEDISGVECRPENAKKVLEIEEEEEVTLEERTKKEMDEKAKKVARKSVGVKKVAKKSAKKVAKKSLKQSAEKGKGLKLMKKAPKKGNAKAKKSVAAAKKAKK